MTLAYGYATWRAAYDFALSEISKPEYMSNHFYCWYLMYTYDTGTTYLFL